ncbi:MAG: hypothetical protein LBS99_06410 [Clostridiales bacterium]|jgi:hypothetical protein|nr:hypothetical protein [Clostridiales bacterium]
MDELVQRIVAVHGCNNPILTEDILAAWSEYSRARVFQLLKKAVMEKRLVKYAYGVYYVPATASPGVVPVLDFRSIIEKKYIRDGGEVFGYYSGTTLKNHLGLIANTPDIPEIASSKASAKYRVINVGGGTVIVRRAKTKVTTANAAALQVLELFNDNNGIFDKDGLKKIGGFVCQAGLKPSDVFAYAKVFPARAMQNLITCGIENVFTASADTSDVYQLAIPETDTDRYVSGRYALNLPGETSGDWHFTSVWFSDTPCAVELWGKGQKRDTTAVLGSFGIADRFAAVEKTGIMSKHRHIYAADHYRAILDLLIVGAANGVMSLVKGATTDYLDTQEQKEYLLSQAEKALSSPHLSTKQKALIKEWIERESRNIYRGEAYAV